MLAFSWCAKLAYRVARFVADFGADTSKLSPRVLLLDAKFFTALAASLRKKWSELLNPYTTQPLWSIRSAFSRSRFGDCVEARAGLDILIWILICDSIP
jgi:hypothetical protein